MFIQYSKDAMLGSLGTKSELCLINFKRSYHCVLHFKLKTEHYLDLFFEYDI